MMAKNLTRFAETSEIANNLRKMQKELGSRSSSIFVLENVIYSFGEIFTILGNLLALFIVLRNQTLRRAVPNMLIISLSTSGLLNGLLVVPVSHAVLVTSKWPSNYAFCQFQGFMVVFLGTTAVLTLALMSISRFYSVVKNTLYRRYFTFKRTVIMIVVAWLLGLSAPVLYLATDHNYIFIPAKLICYVPVKTSWFLILLAVFYVGLPSLVVLFSYLQIFLTVRKHNASVFNTRNARGSNVHELNTTWMMFVIVVCFCICWFPVLLIETIDIIREHWSLPRPVYVIFTMLGGLSNALNPIIYGVMNSALRREFIRFFKCKLTKKNQTYFKSTRIQPDKSIALQPLSTSKVL